MVVTPIIPFSLFLSRTHSLLLTLPARAHSAHSLTHSLTHEWSHDVSERKAPSLPSRTHTHTSLHACALLRAHTQPLFVATPLLFTCGCLATQTNNHSVPSRKRANRPRVEAALLLTLGFVEGATGVRCRYFGAVMLGRVVLLFAGRKREHRLCFATFVPSSFFFFPHFQLDYSFPFKAQ